LGIPQDQRNIITTHVELAARRCLQWRCQRIANIMFILSTQNFKTQKIFGRICV